MAEGRDTDEFGTPLTPAQWEVVALMAEVVRLRRALYTAIVSPEDDPAALGVVLDHEAGEARLSGSTEAR